MGVKSFKCEECSRFAQHTPVFLHGMKVCTDCEALAEQTDNFKATGHFDENSVLAHLAHIAQSGGEISGYTEIKALALTPIVFVRHTRACKLFDYERRQWTDFDGTPTGPVIPLDGGGKEAPPC